MKSSVIGGKCKRYFLRQGFLDVLFLTFLQSGAFFFTFGTTFGGVVAGGVTTGGAVVGAATEPPPVAMTVVVPTTTELPLDSPLPRRGR